MPRGSTLAALTAVLLVTTTLAAPIATAQSTPSAPNAPTEGETRVDHGDAGFVIYDNGTFIGPAGDTASVDAAVGSPVSDEEVNTGNHKSYDFVANPPENKEVWYEATVEYDHQVYERIVGEDLCGAELHMELIDENGTVVEEETRDCIDDISVDGRNVAPGAYTLEVWSTEKSVAPTPFETTIDVDYI